MTQLSGSLSSSSEGQKAEGTALGTKDKILLFKKKNVCVSVHVCPYAHGGQRLMPVSPLITLQLTF